jgi:hypothetical protein
MMTSYTTTTSLNPLFRHPPRNVPSASGGENPERGFYLNIKNYLCQENYLKIMK